MGSCPDSLCLQIQMYLIQWNQNLSNCITYIRLTKFKGFNQEDQEGNNITNNLAYLWRLFAFRGGNFGKLFIFSKPHSTFWTTWTYQATKLQIKREEDAEDDLLLAIRAIQEVAPIVRGLPTTLETKVEDIKSQLRKETQEIRSESRKGTDEINN